jgi:peptidoglycan hydrolase-like protein with peptidoglycan-binding domain
MMTTTRPTRTLRARVLSPLAAGLLLSAALLAPAALVPGHATAAGRFTHALAACPATIAYGSRGGLVVTLQNKLNTYPTYVDGPYFTPDGIFGQRTRAAVVQFQSYYRLGVDGIVGPQTWHQLGYC